VTADAWTVLYYSSPLLAGTPVASEVISATDTLEFDWVEEPPPAEIDLEKLGARLNTVRALESGVYQFRVAGEGRLRLSIDGRTVIDRWRAGEWEEVAIAPLRAGRHRIVLSFGAAPGRDPWLTYELSLASTPEIPTRQITTPAPLVEPGQPTSPDVRGQPSATPEPWWYRFRW